MERIEKKKKGNQFCKEVKYRENWKKKKMNRILIL